jgi:Asp-tRNA(Asn)/Glu-tRNA(Gln) amidotransferase A subunit family amidase
MFLRALTLFRILAFPSNYFKIYVITIRFNKHLFDDRPMTATVRAAVDEAVEKLRVKNHEAEMEENLKFAAKEAVDIKVCISLYHSKKYRTHSAYSRLNNGELAKNRISEHSYHHWTPYSGLNSNGNALI